jgi:hypothetical protein
MNRENLSTPVFTDRDFREKNSIKEIILKEKLYSKKNDVYKTLITFNNGSKKDFVFKKYVGENKSEKLKNEVFFYNILSKTFLKIPQIYYMDRDFLILEYLGDVNLLDYVAARESSFNENTQILCNNGELIKKYPLLYNALSYIFNFNKLLYGITKKSYVLKDLNFRNFLFNAGILYRVDFEDCGPGALEQDFGRFIAFLLTYDPSFTGWKLNTSKIIKKICADSFNIDLRKIEKETSLELKSMKQRRNLKKR